MPKMWISETLKTCASGRKLHHGGVPQQSRPITGLVHDDPEPSVCSPERIYSSFCGYLLKGFADTALNVTVVAWNI